LTLLLGQQRAIFRFSKPAIAIAGNQGIDRIPQAFGEDGRRAE